MAKIRITGLVKAMNDVRQKLAAGIPSSEADAFRKQVLGIVTDVETLCRQNRITPKQLPPPSFRAYTFLKTLDLEDLPLINQDAPVPTSQLRIKNLVSICSALHGELDQLARSAAAKTPTSHRHAQAGLTHKIQTQVEAIETLAKQAGTTPAALPVRSRRAYQWLKFLSEPLNLEAHCALLAAAHQLAQEVRERQPNSSLDGKAVQFELYHTSHLYRVHPAIHRTRIVINEGFVTAPQEVIKAIILITHGLGTEADRQRVKAYAASDDFAEVVQALEVSGFEPNLFTQGRTYDLEEVFERVNAGYFGGSMPHPQLTWNATLSRRKFGHYQPASDTVMISITLDDPQVPAYVIEFVMYHELLHKALGIQISNGRRYAHTREFREKEKLFQPFEEAKAYLNQLARE